MTPQPPGDHLNHLQDNEANAVLVMSGGSVDLQACVLTSSTTFNGLAVHDEGSRATARGCTMENSSGSGVQVMEGGRVELTGCKLRGSKTMNGVEVGGQVVLGARS